VLAQAIYREGAKLVVAGMNPMDLKRGIDKAVEAIAEELGKLSKPTRSAEEIAQVGTISANSDTTIGETISEKAGVVNLSLDGSILLSAMTGFAAAFVTDSVIIGFLAAMAVSIAVAALVAFSSIELRLNQIAVGFVLFLLARQLALFLGTSYVGEAGPKVPAWDIPLLSDIPILGNLFKTTSKVKDRTELLVLITPRVIRNRGDAQKVTDELRNRLRTIEPLEQRIRSGS